jgi:hypothetical protein
MCMYMVVLKVRKLTIIIKSGDLFKFSTILLMSAHFGFTTCLEKWLVHSIQRGQLFWHIGLAIRKTNNFEFQRTLKQFSLI